MFLGLAGSNERAFTLVCFLRLFRNRQTIFARGRSPESSCREGDPALFHFHSFLLFECPEKTGCKTMQIYAT